MKRSLIEGVDYYLNEQGYVVLTAKYHLERGQCCGNGCLHCPYDYVKVSEPRRQELLNKRIQNGYTQNGHQSDPPKS